MSLKYIINRCMPNRNGIDDLFTLNIILIIPLLIADIFINNIYLSLSIVLLIGILIFRVFSTNISQRRKENKVYVRFKTKINKKFNLYKDIIVNYNTALYKRCPKCKRILKLPLKKGTHKVICPDCQEKFTVKCKRNEVIKATIVK